MSDSKRDDARERRLYRRHRRDERGVSPVVATIILVAIAVAAAAALYLFIQNYQSKLQSGISSNNVNSQYQFSMGGSTTVYPLSQLGIKWFEQNNTLYNITDQQGGSVAGAEAYCSGQVDVGAASTSFTTAQLVGDGCSSSLASATVQNVVAVDAIVGIASVNNPIFGTVAGTITPAQFSFNATTMLAAYIADSTTTPSSNTGVLNTYTFPIYLCGANAATVATWTGTSAAYLNTCPALGSHASLPWGDIPFPAGCAVQAGTVWNFAACTFATANTHTIVAYQRGDSSGTSQGFTQKYLSIPKDASGNSCGTDNQPVSCGITVTPEVGNPALAAAVAADANGLGYNSYGQAIAQVTPALHLAGYAAVQVGSVAQPVVQPSVQTVLQYGYEGKNPSAAYGPWRVLEYLTDGTPTPGSAQATYLGFVLGPQVNLALAQATGYISLYAA
jgi:flagellin-like protein